MKVKNTNELWLLNKTTADVHLSDLGVKVPAGKTVNVYGSNPYLTETQVEASRDQGSLSKRLTAKALMVVKKAAKNAPLKALKASTESNMKAIKTKSSVVLEPDSDTYSSDEGFDFADYGVIDMGPSVSQVAEDDGTVMVHAKQDSEDDQDAGVELKPLLESGISKQSQIVMKATTEAMVDPTGPHAEASATQPFTVTKPPKDTTPEPKASTPSNLSVSKGEFGEVLVGEKKKSRSIRTVKKAQEEGADGLTLPGDDEVGADEVVAFQETKYDSKVATTTEDGSVVMKLKEEEDQPKKKVKKSVTKKKAKTSKKK